MEYTHGAMIAFAGRNEGLALDNQLSNCELSSRAKISQRKINKRFNFMSKNTGIVWRSLPNIMHLTQSFHTTVRIPVSWMTSSTCRHNTSITDVLNSAQKWKNILSTKEITKKKKYRQGDVAAREWGRTWADDKKPLILLCCDCIFNWNTWISWFINRSNNSNYIVCKGHYPSPQMSKCAGASV